MRIRVLGSAAGGGFPQWNCGCSNCAGVRARCIPAAPRTQECVAFSADDEAWFLVNASPEIRYQIESFAPLQPRRSRHSPIAGILLTNGDLDHCLGLLSLRESWPLTIYATDAVARGFTEGNVLYRTLQRFPGQVTWHLLKSGREEELMLPDGRPSGLSVEAVAVPGKPPIHLESARAPELEDSVGFHIRDTEGDALLAYFSGVARLTAAVREALAEADCVFFDGTFWSEHELPALGLGDKTASEMAHMPIGGATGSLGELRALRAARRVFIHVNNTNPMLRGDSPERLAAAVAGWEVAWDGMEIEL